jgi:hypothetical protein
MDAREAKAICAAIMEVAARAGVGSYWYERIGADLFRELTEGESDESLR